MNFQVCYCRILGRLNSPPDTNCSLQAGVHCGNHPFPKHCSRAPGIRGPEVLDDWTRKDWMAWQTFHSAREYCHPDNSCGWLQPGLFRSENKLSPALSGCLESRQSILCVHLQRDGSPAGAQDTAMHDVVCISLTAFVYAMMSLMSCIHIGHILCAHWSY